MYWPLSGLTGSAEAVGLLIWISSLSLVSLIARDKITPLPLKHLSFQFSVQGTCSFKPVAELVPSLGTASRLWSMMLVLRLLPCLAPAFAGRCSLLAAPGVLLGFGSNACGGLMGKERGIK